jgi:hypothetical protein
MVSFKSTRDFATIGLVFALLALSGRADAQSPRSLRDLYSGAMAADALADEYGQAIIDELGRLMSQRADPDCLKSRSIPESALKQSAGEILLRYGARVRAMLYPDVDNAALEAEFTRLAGPQAVEELRNLASHPGVQRIRMLGTPVRNDNLVNEIAKAFDFHLMLAKLDLGQHLSPIGSGNADLNLLSEKRGIPVYEFGRTVEGEDWYQRFGVLLEHLWAAEEHVVKATGQGKAPTHSAFVGVEADLRASCIRLGNS